MALTITIWDVPFYIFRSPWNQRSEGNSIMPKSCHTTYTVVAMMVSVSWLSFMASAHAYGCNFRNWMRGKNVALLLKLLQMRSFCVVYKLLAMYNMKCLIHISPKGTGNISASTAEKFCDYQEYRMIVVIYELWFALQKLTYVNCALLLPALSWNGYFYKCHALLEIRVWVSVRKK